MQGRSHQYADRLGKIRQDALSFLQSARKTVDLLPSTRKAPDALDHAKAEWGQSAGDFGDALMVAVAKEATIRNVLADDIDLLTFDGITVYTANQTAIQDAKAAGKLV